MSSAIAEAPQPAYPHIPSPDEIATMQETAATPDRLLDELSFSSRKMVIAVRRALDKMNVQWRNEQCRRT